MPHSGAVFNLAPDRDLIEAAETSPGCVATSSKASDSLRYHNAGVSHRGQVPSKQAANRTVHLPNRQGILSLSTPLPGFRTAESAVRAPPEREGILRLKSTYFVHVLQRFDACHELEGVKAGVVSTDIALEGTFLNLDTKSMGDQTKIWIARRAVDRAFVLEYEDMVTG